MDYNAFFYYGGILLLGYIVSILMHEVGHYLCYLQYKGKNNLKVQWLEFLLDCSNQTKTSCMTLRQPPFGTLHFLATIHFYC
jgi:predicted SprT family Zn-dependent metalloprotease